jgi:GT2 family glycosyltransferase
VVATRNRPQAVRACLEALAAQTMEPGTFEVIVVDDAGEQPLMLDVASWTAAFPLTLIRQENAGPGAARNRGCNQARDEIVAFTDDDCLPTPTWLEQLVSAVLGKPRALVGGTTLNGLSDSLFSETSQLIIEISYEHFNRDTEKAFFLTSNNMACARSAYLSIGGFNEAFRIASEDRELCDRWRFHGGPMGWEQEALVEHRHRQTFLGFTRLHFRYGQGAFRFHQQIRGRRARRETPDFSLHAALPRALWRRRSRWTMRRGLLIVALLAWWELVNLAGFLWAWRQLCSSRKT